MAKRKLSPYERIVRAAGKGRGIRLSSEEVLEMALDHAVSERASNDGTCPMCFGTGKLQEGLTCPNCEKGWLE